MLKALPRIEPVGPIPAQPRGVALVLHGGRAHGLGSGEPRGGAYLRMVPFARQLARLEGLAVYLLRYRYQGWNGSNHDPVHDAEQVLRELAQRHPGVPVALVGHSMGGRAALHAAGAPNVIAVCALAPWLDGTDPVAQLAGRTVLIAHGDRDHRTDPGASHRYARAARAVTDEVCRFELTGSGHAMLRRAGDWHALVRRFVAGALRLAPLDPVISDALGRQQLRAAP